MEREKQEASMVSFPVTALGMAAAPLAKGSGRGIWRGRRVRGGEEKKREKGRKKRREYRCSRNGAQTR